MKKIIYLLTIVLFFIGCNKEDKENISENSINLSLIEGTWTRTKLLEYDNNEIRVDDDYCPSEEVYSITSNQFIGKFDYTCDGTIDSQSTESFIASKAQGFDNIITLDEEVVYVIIKLTETELV